MANTDQHPNCHATGLVTVPPPPPTDATVSSSLFLILGRKPYLISRSVARCRSAMAVRMALVAFRSSE